MTRSMRTVDDAASRQRGFTLLEMVIALAALSLLMVMLTGTVQFGARAWEGQSRRVEAYAETDAVHSVLRTMLQAARPIALTGFEQPAPTTSQNGNAPGDQSQQPPQPADQQPPQPADQQPPQPADQQQTQQGQSSAPQANQQSPQGQQAQQGEQRTGIYLIGQRDSVDFVGELPEMAGQAGLYDIRLWRNSEGRLLMSWRRHVRIAAGQRPPRYQDTELLRNVTTLELAYFSAATERQPGGWSATWSRNAALPALISVRVRFRSGDPRIWRELTVAPILGAVQG